ncbi:unnamed protein product [Trifolium pratense]|uniref:Uncharacterized protein n=1 Tax=Trifolium pratense TaxID=57577 RepID=A0ACB0LE04_TRIPR|nr:unnamed protein product [Trifolium pratense]
MNCIGSSPRFEDGDFESAKLRRPAGSYYHSTDDCLYFLDSEVVIFAVLYCKLKKIPNSNDDNQEKYAARILDFLSSKRTGKKERDSWNAFTSIINWYFATFCSLISRVLAGTFVLKLIFLVLEFQCQFSCLHKNFNIL